MLQLSNRYALCNQSIHGIAHINSLNDKNENAHPDIRFIIVHVKMMMPLHAQMKCDAKISRFNTHVAVTCILLLFVVFFSFLGKQFGLMSVLHNALLRVLNHTIKRRRIFA